jgi:hypothetical protein
MKDITERPSVLLRPRPGSHMVYTYRDTGDVAQAAGAYIGAGLGAGAMVVVIATPEHRAGFAAHLRSQGFDWEAACRRGQLLEYDAQDTLAKFMEGDMPDPEKFNTVVGGILEKASTAGAGVRAFGEMVNILWRRGNLPGAIGLEELWNGLGRRLSFSLFCAYELDHLDEKAYDGPLHKICDVHSDFIPDVDNGRFENHVRESAADVLGVPIAGLLRTLAADDKKSGVPSGQKILFWLRENIPLTAGKILARVRARYDAAA